MDTSHSLVNTQCVQIDHPNSNNTIRMTFIAVLDSIYSDLMSRLTTRTGQPIVGKGKLDWTRLHLDIPNFWAWNEACSPILQVSVSFQLE